MKDYLPKTLMTARNVLINIIPEKSKIYKQLCLFGFKISAKNKHKKRNLLRISIPVVDHCNLNCKYCTAFSPVANETYLDFDQYKKDMQRIADLSGHTLESIVFTGGEPLLHPRLTEMFDIARKLFKNADISCLTNGVSLVKMPDDFWLGCSRNRISIKISQYPIDIKSNKVAKIADQFNVIVENAKGHTREMSMWKYPLDIKGKQPLKNSFNICNQVNGCIRIKNGIIYPCNTIATIEHFNKYFKINLEVTDSDVIDIYKVKTIEEIYDFLVTPKPFCRYCNRRGVTFGHKWEPSERKITEWI